MRALGGAKEIYAAISHFHNVSLLTSKKHTDRQHILDYRSRIGAM
jgi:hypothetical protein